MGRQFSRWVFSDSTLFVCKSSVYWLLVLTQFIGHVGVGILAGGSNVNGNVGNEGVHVGVLWPEDVAPDTSVGAKIENI